MVPSYTPDSPHWEIRLETDAACIPSMACPRVRGDRWVVLLFVTLCFGALCGGLRAQSETSLAVAGSGAASVPVASDFFENRGRWNFGAQLAYAVENAIPRNISHINMLIAQPQVGLIVADLKGSKFPLRRFEILGEGILGGAVHPGGRMLGATLMFRFDFKPWKRAVPFLDVGSGPLNTTTNLHAPELSGHFQFMSQGGVGIQYFFRPQRAFVMEFRYLHMSNAGVESPNLGFNASMLTLGFRWLRSPRPAPARL
jgi:hypothetical protein